MKILILAALLLAAPMSFASSLECPSFAGEYSVRACPVQGRPSQTTIIYQPKCHALGFQILNKAADGKVSYNGPVRWQPVGLGKILVSEDTLSATFQDSFYDADSLYTATTRVLKADNQSSLISMQVIDQLPEGNLFASNEIMSSGNLWINLKNCK